MDQVQYDTVTLVAAGLEVSFNYTGVTFQAMTHNKIPAVHNLVARHIGEASYEGESVSPSSPMVARVFAEVGGVTLFDTGPIGIRSVAYQRSLSIDCFDKSLISEELTLDRGSSLEGDIHFSLSCGDTNEFIKERKRFQILASNEWLNSSPYYATLAAFVYPNAPEISELLMTVEQILGSRTGNSEINGYQGGTQRALEITGAIYEALGSLAITHLPTSLSPEHGGIRVRSAAEVLHDRVGTSVDLTLLFASLSERCGLHPLIFLLDGNIYSGILLRDDSLPEPVVLDGSIIRNLIRTAHILPVEAGFYRNSHLVSLRSAVESATSIVEAEPVSGVVGIRSCHEDNIRSLGVVESGIAEHRESEILHSAHLGAGNWELPTVEIPDVDASTRYLSRNDDSPARVQNWKSELLDLSMRNRLLHMRKGREVIPLHIPTGKVLATLDDLIHGNEILTLRSFNDVSHNRRIRGDASIENFGADEVLEELVEKKRVYVDLTEAKYHSTLRELRRTATRYLEETGASNLYLTLGAISHETGSGAIALAPLFLIPLKLLGGEGQGSFRIQVDSSAVASANYSLVQWLQVKHNLHIPALEEIRLDESGIDMEYALSEIAQALIKAKLPFSVEEDARIIIARFSTYEMWKDLEDHWETFMESPVFKHFTLDPGSSFVDPAGETDFDARNIDEGDIPLPIPADGTQLAAVHAAGNGHSFVLEGPPGTGKSQTITNMIAHCLDKGKTVLFVAEKQAALSVVKRRLKQAGLDTFTLDLHGKDQSPKAIKDQLKTALEVDMSYDLTTWDHVRSVLKNRLVPLQEYPSCVHDPNIFGLSLWSSFGLSQLNDGIPELEIPVSFVRNPGINRGDFELLIAKVVRAARTTNFDQIKNWPIVGGRIEGDLNQAWRELQQSVVPVSRYPELLERAFANPGEALDKLLTVDPNWLLDPDEVGQYLGVPERLEEVASSLGSVSHDLLALTQVFSDTFVRVGDPEPIMKAIDDLSQGYFGRRKKRKKYADELRDALPLGVEPDIDGAHSPSDISVLLRRLPLIRRVYEENFMTLRTLPGLHGIKYVGRLDSSLSVELSYRATEIRKAQNLASSRPEDIRALKEALRHRSSEGIKQELTVFIRAWRQFCAVLGSSSRNVELWRAGRTWLDAYTQSEPIWGIDIEEYGDSVPRAAAEWNSISARLIDLNLASVVDALEQKRIRSSELEGAVNRGLSRASIKEHLGRINVESVDAKTKSQEIEQLQDSFDRLRDQAPRAFATRLLNRRSFHRRSQSGAVGRLRRDLKVRRNAKSFRTLFSEYPEEILETTPCILVSPSTLAANIPPYAAKFDVVIFDEASQITVDQAMGAIGRARSVVIAGDSKQMPPTRFGRTMRDDDIDYSEETDDELAGVDDLESILSEAVESGLEQVWLSWHYRSHDEELIAFSNVKYYDGKLSSLPSPGSEGNRAVELVPVNGQFIRKPGAESRTNPAEAKEVVEEIRRRVNNPATAKESIGVVTFNAPQRDLILDMLEGTTDVGIKRHMEHDREPIFVKNLENVQGDERDIILFSTGFSKYENGRPLPMNFGPLNRKGGERRLNVAITRARQKVLIFSSFRPEEIDPRRTQSLGMLHLREYMIFAQSQQSLDKPQREVRGFNDNVVRDELSDALEVRGFEVEKDYGLSSYTLDLVIRPRGTTRWIAAVMTDSKRWSELPTVADRDLTPNLLRTIMDWPKVFRVWLPEWITSRESIIDRIEAEVRALAERRGVGGANETPQHPKIDDTVYESSSVKTCIQDSLGEVRERAVDREGETVIDTTEPRSHTKPAPRSKSKLRRSKTKQPTNTNSVKPKRSAAETKARVAGRPRNEPVPEEVEWTPPTCYERGEPADLEEPVADEVRMRLRDCVPRIIERSGPLTLDSLISAVMKAFGTKQQTPVIEGLIREALGGYRITRDPHNGVEFLWPEGTTAVNYVQYRPDSSRAISEIHVRELENNVLTFAERDRERVLKAAEEFDNVLVRRVFHVFGGSTFTEQAQARIQFAVKGAVRRIRESSDD